MNDSNQPNSDLHWKPVLGVFVLTLVLYLVGYNWIESRRHDKGPWKLTFAIQESGMPGIMVEQSELGIKPTLVQFNVNSDFLKELKIPDNAQSILFELEKEEFDLPFGLLSYRDPTFLPGVVTLEVFGAIIECLPRTLVVNQKELEWNSLQTITVDCSAWNGPEQLDEELVVEVPNKDSAP
jgi:hypothetical protein